MKMKIVFVVFFNFMNKIYKSYVIGLNKFKIIK